jgi:hypothetical protein
MIIMDAFLGLEETWIEVDTAYLWSRKNIDTG